MGRSDWLVVGIAGCTCSGKTSLSKKIHEIFPSSVLLHQDDYFFDVSSDKHVKIPELNHINFEILSSLDNDKFLEKIWEYLSVKNQSKNLLILEGFLLLNEPRIAELCDIKVFFTLDKTTCWERRSVRTYEPPDPPGYFENYVWPFYLKHLQEIRDKLSDVIYIDGLVNIEEIMPVVVDSVMNKTM